ncbi:MAG TPA: Mur ligase family protein, partial [Candidatus Nanoarchaeia archaeon]|nr:Mur ligase family protein [Candidatus Nanoarchaeia archaeon]
LSYNTPLGIAKFAKTLTGDEEVLIFEMGEYYPGDIRDLCSLIDPSMGVITGINEAHLAKFKTLDRTVNTIFELGDHLGEQPLYVNSESQLAADRIEAGYPYRYSRQGVNGWRVSDVATSLEGTSFTATKDDVVIKARSRLLGLHQVGPLVAMIDIASALGLSAEQIDQGIAATRPFEHRMQPSRDAGGVVTIDDSYNGNPDGAKAAIEFLASLPGRRFYVTPGLVEMGDHNQEVHREIGRALAKAEIDQVILIKNSATPYIAEGLQQASFKGKLTWYDDPLKCFAALPSMTVAGDVVLIQNDWTDNYA